MISPWVMFQRSDEVLSNAIMCQVSGWKFLIYRLDRRSCTLPDCLLCILCLSDFLSTSQVDPIVSAACKLTNQRAESTMLRNVRNPPRTVDEFTVTRQSQRRAETGGTYMSCHPMDFPRMQLLGFSCRLTPISDRTSRSNKLKESTYRALIFILHRKHLAALAASGLLHEPCSQSQ